MRAIEATRKLKLPTMPKSLEPIVRLPESRTSKLPFDHSSTEPLSPASPNRSTEALARRCQAEPLTSISRLASSLMILSRSTLPRTSSRKELGAIPSRVVLEEVLSFSLPAASMVKMPPGSSILNETSRKSAKPVEVSAAPPLAWNSRAPSRVNLTSKASWKPVGPTVMSRLPLAVASMRLMAPWRWSLKPTGMEEAPRV